MMIGQAMHRLVINWREDEKSGTDPSCYMQVSAADQEESFVKRMRLLATYLIVEPAAYLSA
jgi:hypothetical protein